MSCSIMNEQIQMHLDQTGTLFHLLLDKRHLSHRTESSSRSALQVPELSRLELHHLLRVAERSRYSSKITRQYWKAFLSSQHDVIANSNQLDQ